MAGYKALASVERSLKALLERRFRAELGPNPPEVVLVGTADLDKVNTAGSVITFPAVSVFCYRLSVDRETRPLWSSVASADGRPRLPLRMHLLVTAWDKFVESELEMLGLVARTLETDSILAGPLLDTSGEWGPDETVEVVPEDMALESMSEAFQALTADFRLYLLYQARVVVIEGAVPVTEQRVATVELAGTAER
jgi:hypothetical protein